MCSFLCNVRFEFYGHFEGEIIPKALEISIDFSETLKSLLILSANWLAADPSLTPPDSHNLVQV